MRETNLFWVLNWDDDGVNSGGDAGSVIKGALSSDLGSKFNAIMLEMDRNFELCWIGYVPHFAGSAGIYEDPYFVDVGSKMLTFKFISQ